MNKMVAVGFSLCFSAWMCWAEDAQLQRAKLELLVEQAGELLAESNRSGSELHTATCRYYFGLVYGSGTNLLARKDSPATTQLLRKYVELVEKNYKAYTKVEDAANKAAATGNDTIRVGRHVVSNGARHRAKRIANAEKLGERELAAAIREWEAFVGKIKKSRD